MEFLKQNVMLIGLAIGSGLMLLWPMLNRGGSSGVPNLTPNEAVLMMNRNQVLILDVRDEAEFAAGHISNAKHIPVAELGNRIKEIQKYKDKPVIVNCQGGVRSSKACNILRKLEFTQLNNLQGGLNAWTQAKLPLVKPA
ncbi:MAG: rhodanese-like domain-containing protein [Methylophilaceae bacterium]|nr:rhodanese-like domain-containing protein [Methylophilaceae bacterium]